MLRKYISGLVEVRPRATRFTECTLLIVQNLNQAMFICRTNLFVPWIGDYISELISFPTLERMMTKVDADFRTWRTNFAWSNYTTEGWRSIMKWYQRFFRKNPKHEWQFCIQSSRQSCPISQKFCCIFKRRLCEKCRSLSLHSNHR